MDKYITSRPIYIYAPPFSERSGGAIALHYLAHKCREMGANVFVCPFRYKGLPLSNTDRIPFIGHITRLAKAFVLSLPPELYFRTCDTFNVSVSSRITSDDAIVVYPEIIAGNPLKSKRVVRWFLHKQGFFNPLAKYEEGDLIFYYQTAFTEGLPRLDDSHHLRLRWIRDDIYFEGRHGNRAGSCVLLRKGKISGILDQEHRDGIIIDRLNHHEKAKIFRKTRFFYSYDLYTMYCFYAALCGCVPIVVPKPGVSRDEWRPDVEDRYGVAYGEDDIEWAIRTRPLMIEKFYKDRDREAGMVLNFLQKLKEVFG